MWVQSLYGNQISLIYDSMFYDSVENGWKMLDEICKGLKVFGWNKKNTDFVIKGVGIFQEL